MSKDSITVEIEFDEIQKAVNKSVEKITSSTYSNPIKDCVERAFKKEEGAIETMVNEIITESLTSPEFKEKIGEVVLNNMVSSAVKGR